MVKFFLCKCALIYTKIIKFLNLQARVDNILDSLQTCEFEKTVNFKRKPVIYNVTLKQKCLQNYF